jgi:proteic killer suppression protein
MCATCNAFLVIESFKHDSLKQLDETGRTASIQSSHRNKLRVQVVALDTSRVIDDMNIPGFRLHQLSGKKKGNWVIDVR